MNNNKEHKEEAVLYFEKALSSEKNGDFDSSLKYLDKAIELNKKYYEAFIKKGDILIEHYHKEAGNAANSYYEAINIRPNKIEAYVKMSWACVELGDYDDALEFCEKGFEISPNEYKEYYCDKAYILFFMKRYEESIENSDKYIIKYPDSEKPYHTRIMCFYELGKYKEVVIECDKAIKLDENDIKLNYIVFKKKVLKKINNLID